MKFAVLLLLLVVACGGTASLDIAPAASTGAVPTAPSEPTSTSVVMSTTADSGSEVDAPEPTPIVEGVAATGPDAELIEFEALWLCEAQRQTFDSPGAVDETLNLRLGETGLARADYDTFKAGLSDNAGARKQILDLFVANCS